MRMALLHRAGLWSRRVGRVHLILFATLVALKHESEDS
jgi:hypothetical protein